MGYHVVTKLEFSVGTDIEKAVKDALEVFQRSGTIVEFNFNGEPMNVFFLRRLDEPIEKQKARYVKEYFKRLSENSSTRSMHEIIDVISHLLYLGKKAQEEGLLALDYRFQELEKNANHSYFDPLYFGLKCVMWGEDSDNIEAWMLLLRRWCVTEIDKLYHDIVTTGILMIQEGSGVIRMSLNFGCLLPKAIRNGEEFKEVCRSVGFDWCDGKGFRNGDN
jgi:hypothetical protein